MDNSNTNSNENVLPSIKTPKVFYIVLVIILFLIIALFLMYFKVNFFLKVGKSDQQTINNVLTTFFFCLIVIFLCGLLLPNFKDIIKSSSFFIKTITNTSFNGLPDVSTVDPEKLKQTLEQTTIMIIVVGI
jgi:phosphatidylglycerophosphate synthase